MNGAATHDKPLRLSEAFERFEAALSWGEPNLPEDSELGSIKPVSLAEQYNHEDIQAAREFWAEYVCDEFMKLLASGRATAFVQRKKLERLPKKLWRRLRNSPRRRQPNILDRSDKAPLYFSADEANRICRGVEVGKFKILNESYWSLNQVQVWRTYRSIEAMRHFENVPSEIAVDARFFRQFQEGIELEIEEAGRRGELRASGRNSAGARGKRITLAQDYWIDHNCQEKIFDQDDENTLGPNPVWDLKFSTGDVLHLWPPTNADLKAHLGKRRSEPTREQPRGAPKFKAVLGAFRSLYPNDPPDQLTKEVKKVVRDWLMKQTPTIEVSDSTIKTAFQSFCARAK